MALGESFQFEIGADIRAARENLDALKRRIGDLKGDVDRVDGSEIDVEVDGSEVDDIRQSVDDLRRTAERGIDLNVDSNGTAARTAADVRRMQVNAEGLQRGIGPLRGFTDELGAAAGTGGMAANAMIDAGEAVEVFGAQLGISQEKLGRYSLVTFVSKAGLEAGIGIALGVAIPLIKMLADGQDEVAENTQKANDRLKDQTGLLDLIEGRLDNQPSIVDALLPEEERNELIRAFFDVGVGVDPRLDRGGLGRCGGWPMGRGAGIGRSARPGQRRRHARRGRRLLRPAAGMAGTAPALSQPRPFAAPGGYGLPLLRHRPPGPGAGKPPRTQLRTYAAR